MLHIIEAIHFNLHRTLIPVCTLACTIGPVDIKKNKKKKHYWPGCSCGVGWTKPAGESVCLNYSSCYSGRSK